MDGDKEVNIIYSFGYENELTHTGMIHYMCDLWNNNNKIPLETFLKSLTGIDLLKKLNKLYAVREFDIGNRKRADLVIQDDNSTTIIAIEMKTKSLIDEEQLKSYLTSKNLTSGTFILLITLGLSEFNDRKSEGNNKIKQVKTQQIYDAVKAIPKNNKDLLLNQWENSLKNNLELSKIFTEKRFKEFKEKLSEMSCTINPSKYWNIYFLNYLKCEIEKDKGFNELKTTKYRNPLVYYWGASDIILNFWWVGSGNQLKSNNNTYLEINNNAKLNLKFYFPNRKNSDEAKELNKVKSYYKKLFPKSKFRYTEKGRKGKTTTLLSFDIGLTKKKSSSGDELFSYSISKGTTVKEILKILKRYNEGDMR